MTLYAGIDLHSNNNFLAIREHDGKRIFQKKLKNNLNKVLAILEPYKEDLDQIAVESTYNWYWLVDLLTDEHFDVKLANPSTIKKYECLRTCIPRPLVITAFLSA